MSRLQLVVGDHITRESGWGRGYIVVAVFPDNSYTLRSVDTHQEYPWYWPGLPSNMIVNGVLVGNNYNTSSKTAVENKIAIMYKRFENRKNHV